MTSHALHRHIRFALAAALCCLLLLPTSCKQDNYDSGEGQLSMLTADFAELQVEGDTLVRSLTTDDDRHLTLTQPQRLSWTSRPDTTYRALAYYKLSHGNDLQVEPYAFSQVSVGRPLRPERFTQGVRQDPMSVESVWISKNRRWLNLSLLLKVGATQQQQSGHILGLVRDTLLCRPVAEGSADSVRTLCLRLHHEQNGVPEHYTQRFYVSMPFASLEGADTLRLSFHAYEGQVVKTLPLK